MARLNVNEVSIWKSNEAEKKNVCVTDKKSVNEEKFNLRISAEEQAACEADNRFDDYDFYDEELTDEEMDNLFRPKATNSIKDMVPLFIGEILRYETNKNKKMTQADIIRRLQGVPYEVEIGRKAVGRIVNGMSDCGLGYCYVKGQGAWYDPNKKWSYCH